MTAMPPVPVAVIGGGVSGLTTALSLATQGHAVVLYTKEPEGQTTSSVAAAFWYPYKAHPQDKVARWGAETYKQFEELATNTDTGVKIWRFLETTPGVEQAWWKSLVKNFSVNAETEKLPGFSSGATFDNPVIDSSIYLPYLRNCLVSQGGRIVSREISSFSQLFSEDNVVINCSGLGARQLANDSDLHGVRGQIVRIKRHADDQPRLDVTAPDRFSHCIPRTTDTILGGTYEEHEESLNPSESESKAIIDRCSKILPRLKTLKADEILESRCGLRPSRSEVRLEVEEVEHGKFVIHNYGHGGAGFTLSWGCAADVCRLLKSLPVGLPITVD
jgi:D-amino-acid oxidase